MASSRPRRDTPSAYARRPPEEGEAGEGQLQEAAGGRGTTARGRGRRGRQTTGGSGRRQRTQPPEPVPPTEEHEEEEEVEEEQGAAPEDEGGEASGVYQRGPATLPSFPLPQNRLVLRPVPPK